jgi:long-chain acyl-CoA synthetase
MVESTLQQKQPWLQSYPPEVDWRAELKPESVSGILDETARRHAARPAFDFLGRKWSWGEIGDLVDRFAAGLQAEGLEKGGKVAIFLPNSHYYLVAYYATLKAGGTVVNLNPLYPQSELEHMIADSESDFLITADLRILTDKTDVLLRTTRLKKLIVCGFAGSLPLPKNILFRLFKNGDLGRVRYSERVLRFADLLKRGARPKPVAVDPLADIAVLQYTGGTTGTPKGAMLTHANVTANMRQESLWFAAADDGHEKMVGVIPFFHVFAMTAVMNLSVLCGFEIIATPRFDLKETLKLIDRKKPTLFPAVPAIFNAIVHSPLTAQYDLRSLKYCISGGAPLPVEVKRQFERKTGAVLVEGYGLTESSPVACCNPLKGLNKAGSIGLPLPATIIELRDPETHQLVAQGERGELCIRGPQVMKGYWQKPEETDHVMADGCLHTGDIATMDADGYFFIVDRLKDMIITNGYKVYPRNVEEAIYQNPAVEECIVAGIVDVSRGEIVKAWVKPKEGETIEPEALKAFLKDKLSPMEMPRQIEIRDRPLPKTMIGKLSRKDIVAEEAEKQGGVPAS